MSETDVILKPYLLAGCSIALVIYILHMVWGRFGKKIHQKVYAVILNRIAVSYNQWMDKRKTKLFAPLHDLASKASDLSKGRALTVLEVGAGPGANFKYFPDATRVVCVEPNPEFRSYIDTNSHKFPHVRVEKFVNGQGEDLSEIEDNSVDAVVCTLVMCTVQDVDMCLAEIKRVLKPGCSLFFLDHVRGDANSWTYLLQRTIEPVWRPIADNCHVTRQPWKNMEAAGFEVDYELFSGVRGNKYLLAAWRPHCIGTATKPKDKGY